MVVKKHYMMVPVRERERASVLLTSDNDLLKDDRLFFLNYSEASNPFYGFKADYKEDSSRIAYYEGKSEAGNWWLRTSPSGLSGGAMGLVGNDGFVGTFPPRQEGGARPAFNLNRNDICLISNSEAFEPGDTSYPAILQEVPVYWGELNKGEWKLTLKDGSRNGFQASAYNNVSALKDYTDWKVDVSYSGARAGDREYVYALLCDDKDVVLYYNDIARYSESGTVEVWIPAGLEPGKYTLKIFSVQWNGDQQTEYASNFADIPLEVQNIQIPKMNKPYSEGRIRCSLVRKKRQSRGRNSRNRKSRQIISRDCGKRKSRQSENRLLRKPAIWQG